MEIQLLVFDIDDTLYPMSSGFSDHRNGEVVSQFMVDKLGFETREEAKRVRDEYFQRYHSTLKGLTVATREGRLPKPFKQEELGEYWADHCDFSRFLRPDPSFRDTLVSLRDETGIAIVAFTNSPRKYALRCLEFLGLRDLFPDDRVFAVEDVMPACKPEPEAFEVILEALNVQPECAVMFEDSMKNIRVCKQLGMRTVLIDETVGGLAVGGEAALLGDLAVPDDPSVDVVLQSVGQIRTAMPGLWQKRLENVRFYSTDSYSGSVV